MADKPLNPAVYQMQTLSGRGVVYSFSTMYNVPRGFDEQKPYTVALIKLNDGPMVTAQLTDVAPDEVKIDMPVEMVTRKLREDGPEGKSSMGTSFAPAQHVILYRRRFMAKVQALSPEAIEAHLQQLSGWNVVNGKLHRELSFQNFVEAFGFMTKVALLAAAADHHPEWRNVYRSVVIDLVTHAAGDAISERDIDLAQKINQVLGEAG